MPAAVCFKSEHRGWMQDQWSWVFSNFGITQIWQLDVETTDAEISQPTIDIDTADDLKKLY